MARSVVAFIKAKRGQASKLEVMLRDLVSKTRMEPGCIQYDLFADENEPGVFVFVEKWQTDPHLQAHLASPHVVAAMTRRDELIETLEIRQLFPLN